MSTRDGMNYAPSAAKVEKVVKPGEFAFAVAYLDHGHIFGQMNGLSEAGGDCRWVYDPQPERARAFADKYPGVKVADSFEQVLEDPEVKLVAAAAVPCERASIGRGRIISLTSRPSQPLSNSRRPAPWSREPAASTCATTPSGSIPRRDSMPAN